jgi:hypothetical protein
MLGYMAHLAILERMSAGQYAKKAIAFFNTGNRVPTTNSKAYNDACTSGSAKEEQVKTRMAEIEKALKQ